MLTPRSPRIADRPAVLRCCGTRFNGIMGVCTASYSLQQVGTGAVVRCNGRHTAATGRRALQPVRLRCCGTRDRCCEHVVCAALSSQQQVAPGLWSVAAGCAQLQHGTALQQIALACMTLSCALRNRFGCATAGCTALQRVFQHVALLQRAATSGASTCSATESYAVATCGAPLQQTALSCNSPALSH